MAIKGFARLARGIGLLLLCVLLLATGTSAHRPWFNASGSPDPDVPYVLENLSISQVIYGGFADNDRIDYYLLTAPADFSVDLQLVVPDVSECAAFRPTMIVIGPGLRSTGALPSGIALPSTWHDRAGIGWVAIASDTWGLFFEPFTKTTYATSPQFTEKLEGGDYLVAIVEPDGNSGTYGLALGGSERSGGDPQFLEKIAPIEACQPPKLPATPAATPGT